VSLASLSDLGGSFALADLGAPFHLGAALFGADGSQPPPRLPHNGRLGLRIRRASRSAPHDERISRCVSHLCQVVGGGGLED
jgi:hypothetical protein